MGRFASIVNCIHQEMYLPLLISFLAIGWSLSVISVSGHVWESAYAMRERSREVDYYLLKNRIYGSVLTPDYKYGSLMRVGEVYEEVIGALDDHVNCERLPDEVYKDEYNPKTYFYNTQLIPDFPYTFIHKQVWNCTSYSTHPFIQFFRIVSVVQGTRPVDTIFYFDGIEVIKDKTTDQSRQDVNDYATATFKEIKYINPVNNKVVKFGGRLTLSLKGAGTDPLNLFTPVDIFPETQFEADGCKIENLQISDKTYKSKVIAEGSNGKTLRIGKAKYSTIGQTSETAVCTMVLNDDNYNIPLLYTDQYLPECSIFKPKSKDYDATYYGKGADPLGKVNNRCFSIVNQELWDCSYETTEVTNGVSKKVKKSFQRRVTEMVGAIPVEKVEYFGAVSIWKYRLDSKSSSVRIKEIYYHANNIHNQVVFAGKVKLRKPSSSTPVVKQEEAYLYKYNSTVISELPKLLDGSPVLSLKERLVPRSRGGGGGSGGGYSSGGGGYSSSGLEWLCLGAMCAS